MILILKRQVDRLRALPPDQAVPFVDAPPEDLWADDEPMPRQVCETYVFFHQNECCQGLTVDWQSYGKTDPGLKCGSFKRIKIELMLQ
ncbi:hypothetical protein [Paraburkholderia flava]|uniref:hypothetical protein n=1 Tax=Paraburkholderia flava TaxID=2547393 RepID=UPI00105EF7A7|nr:hypothetical protein [Paraburkholderia flava]